MNPFPLVVAMLRRHAGDSVAFIAADRARGRPRRRDHGAGAGPSKGSARAADRFDLIVAAPGSQTDLLLKVVFLQPGSVELLRASR